MKKELWNAYDRELNLLEGITLIRGEKIKKGLYHLVADIIVQHIDGTYLVMRRDINKSYGGLWEATAGGSAMFGETPLMCAIRELREETGIVCNDLVEVARDILDDNHIIFVEFKCVVDCDKNSIILQKGETMDYKWVSEEELKEMRKEKLLTQRTRLILNRICK